MFSIIDDLEKLLRESFARLGLDESQAKVQTSDRPEISDFQSNAAFRLAKTMRTSPNAIAQMIIENLPANAAIKSANVAGGGFINFIIDDAYLAQQAAHISAANKFGVTAAEPAQTIIVDYAGPNVAKPLHVGHLRSAVIGEAIKRISRYMGHRVISDIHWGDWGTPMGMLIAKLKEDHPQWPYFDVTRQGDFPSPSPVTVDVLNRLYPEAAKKFKEDPAFADAAREATVKLQKGQPGYRALWRHFIDVSTDSVKGDLARLNVDFDLWLGESDADAYIPALNEEVEAKHILTESQGAKVIELTSTDGTPLPPLIYYKSDGGLTYATTDLATILMREEQFDPDKIFYVVDKRQALHFRQVFQAAQKIGLIDSSKLEHLGFGTMNDPSGKPFKTRAGGVMRLTELLNLAEEEVVKKTFGENPESPKDDDAATKKLITDIAIASVKYGDLSVQREADYIFDVESMTKAEGKTGPYIQYAGARIRSILSKLDRDDSAAITVTHPAERDLILALLDFANMTTRAFDRRMPNYICDHVYNVAQAFSKFYAGCPVVGAESKEIQSSRVRLIGLTLDQIDTCADMLGIAMPEKMQRYVPEPENGATPAGRVFTKPAGQPGF